MITLGDAVLRLGADLGGLKDDLGAGERETESWVGRVGGNVTKLLGGVIVAGAGLAVSAVAGVGGAALNVAMEVDQATKSLQTHLGITEGQAEHFAGVLKNVYGAGFGESIAEVEQAFATTFNNMGEMAWDLTQDEMGGLLESAFSLRDAFGVDVGESTRTAGLLMANMGVTGAEAMNIITAGFQTGGDRANDLLDTLSEYADDFGEMGFTGSEVLGMLNSGLEAGAWNTDKLADSINEFGVNLRDPAIRDGLAEVDEGLVGIFDQFQAGEITERAAFEGILAGIKSIEDPIARDQAGVMFFRSTWEDLGETAVLAMGDIEGSLVDTEGATDKLSAQYDNLGSLLETVKRRGQLALAPLGDKILELTERFMPKLEDAFAWFETTLMPIIEEVGEIAGTFIDEFFRGLDAGQTPLQAIAEGLDNFLPEETMEQVYDFIDGVQGMIDTVSEFVQEHAEEIKGALTAIGAVLAAAAIASAIMGVVGAIGALVTGIGPIIAIVGLLGAAWAGNWGGIREKTEAVIEWLKPYVLGAIQAIKDWWAENGDAILAKAKLIWDGIKTKVRETLAAVKDTVLTAVTNIKAWWAEHGDTILAKAREIWDAIKEKIDLVTGIISTIFEAFRLAFEGDWYGFGETLRKAWDTIWEEVKTIFTNAKDALVAKVKELIAGMQAKFSEVDWAEVGEKIIDGIKQGLKDNAGKIYSWLTNMAQNALDAVKGFFGIQSPSRVMADEVGAPMIEGIVEGFDSQVENVRKRLRVSFEGMAADLRTSVAVAVQGTGQTLAPAYSLAIHSQAEREDIEAQFSIMEAKGLRRHG